MSKLSKAPPAEDPGSALLNTLLVAYDFFERSECALRWAIAFAKHFHSKIIVLSIENPSPVGEKTSCPNCHEDRQPEREDLVRLKLDKLKDRLTRTGVRFELVRQTGTVADVLIQEAAASHAGLVLMGASGSGHHDPQWLASTTETILHAMSFGIFVIEQDAISGDCRLERIRKIRYVRIGDHASRWLPLLKTLSIATHAAVELRYLAKQYAWSDRSRHVLLQGRCEAEVASLRGLNLPTSWHLEYVDESKATPSFTNADGADLILLDCEILSPHSSHVLHAAIQNVRCPVLILPCEQQEKQRLPVAEAPEQLEQFFD